MQKNNVLATDITSEAVVFRGCTTSELMMIIIASTLFWGPVLCTIGLWLFNSLFAGVGMVMLMTVITMLVGSTVTARLKRDRPEGHYQLRIESLLNKYNIKKYHFYTYHGEMSIGRTRQMVVVRGGLHE